MRTYKKGFYNKNVFESILRYECNGTTFTINMHWKGFYYKNALEMFTIIMHWKGIYCKNALERVLPEDSIEKGFTIRKHWKGF